MQEDRAFTKVQGVVKISRESAVTRFNHQDFDISCLKNYPCGLYASVS